MICQPQGIDSLTPKPNPAQLFDFVSDGNVGDLKDFKAYYAKALGNGLKKNAKQFEIMNRITKQVQLKELIDRWMLQRLKNIIAHQMPKKFDNIVFCRLAPEQWDVYEHVLQSPDYQQLLHADSPCITCGGGEPTKKCHPLNLDGVIARSYHLNNEPCPRCPTCISFPAFSQLTKIANHLELIKPDESMNEEAFERQAAFARMAFRLSDGGDVRRDRTFVNQSHSGGCGKMRALAELLRTWKRQLSKVLLFSRSTQMLDILEDMVKLSGYSYERLDGSTSLSERARRVNRFNEVDSVFIFMLSTRAGGLGINLVSASKEGT